MTKRRRSNQDEMIEFPKKIQKPKEDKLHIELKHIKPLTMNQHNSFDSWYAGKNLFLHGTAGTGKSFIGVYLALKDILANSDYNRLIIIRSTVPSRDQGFLPGNIKEKQKVYESPYYAIMTELCERGDAYEILKQKQIIEFATSSYLRGTTFNNAILVVDEIQNFTFAEADTVLTRIGKDCKVIFCGDFKQTDLIKDNDKSGLLKFMQIIKKMKSFDFIEFGIEDIVRSELVKEYIIAKESV